MLLLSSTSLPEGKDWQYELDGYRAIALKSSGKAHLQSRNDNDFSSRYPTIVRALSSLPDETIIDGEVVALDEDGRPSFNLLQNQGSSGVPLIFYVFDLLMVSGRDVMKEPLSKRRELLEGHVLPRLKEPARYSPKMEASLRDLIESVKEQGFEGLIAKIFAGLTSAACVPVPGLLYFAGLGDSITAARTAGRSAPIRLTPRYFSRSSGPVRSASRLRSRSCPR